MAALTTTPVTPVAPVTPNAPVPVGTTDEILLTACERCGHMAEYRQRAACLLCSLQIARLATGQEEDTCTGKMPPPFPPTTVDDRIATISFRVPGNGHVHRLKVPEDALSFLQDLWSRTPFKVSTGGKAKKLVLEKDGTPVHVLWLISKDVDMHDRKPKCRNYDWLDWTRDNIYVPVTTRTGKTVAESEQSRFEWMSRPGQISDVAPAGMDNSPLEIIDARLRGSEKVGQLVQPYVDPVFAETQANRETGEDEGVVWAFKNAARIPNIPSEDSREGKYDHFENALKGCSVRVDDGPNRSLWAEGRPVMERPDLEQPERRNAMVKEDIPKVPTRVFRPVRGWV